MFENLSSKLDSIFKRLKGHGKLTEQNIQEALKGGEDRPLGGRCQF